MPEQKHEIQDVFEFAKLPPIKGYPELRWTGKHPYESNKYFPARIKAQYVITPPPPPR
jgi:hypothetical protein